MNVYEAMRRVLEYAIDYLDILPDTAASNEDVVAVRQMLAAYDALAPDWDSAPKSAKVFAIDADGRAHWFTRQDAHYPYPNEMGFWIGKQYKPRLPIRIDLPLGIDWRLCKWSREGAK